MIQQKSKKDKYATPMEQRMVERALDAHINRCFYDSLFALFLCCIFTFKMNDISENNKWSMLIAFLFVAVFTSIIMVRGLVAVNATIRSVGPIMDATMVPNKGITKKIGRWPIKYVIIENGDKKAKVKCHNILGYNLNKKTKVRVFWLNFKNLPIVIPDSR